MRCIDDTVNAHGRQDDRDGAKETREAGHQPLTSQRVALEFVHRGESHRGRRIESPTVRLTESMVAAIPIPVRSTNRIVKMG